MAGGNAAQFARQLTTFGNLAKFRTRAVFGQSVSLAYRSVTVGSAITGAPGQPVKTAALLHSWIISFAGWRATISSDLVYAPFIELGIGPYGPLTLRSAVGGFHSLALTRAGWPRIVTMALKDAKAGAI